MVATNTGIKDSNETCAVLHFLHNMGTIIYFGTDEDTAGASQSSLKHLVILDIQWLIDVFRTIITVKPNENQVSVVHITFSVIETVVYRKYKL